MKTTVIIFCATVALLMVGINGQDYAVGVQIAANAGELPPTCTRSEAECASDCSTLMICAANNPTPLQTVLCSSPNQYCVGGACTTKPSPTCTSGPSYVCTDDGVFPEPSDCTRYRVCDTGVSTLYQCPTGFVFNSKLNVCQKGTTPCTKIDCSRATPAKPYILYASNPAYYAYCFINGGNIQKIMFKCSFEQFEKFDITSGTCKFNCATKVYFQNPANCGEYYYCSGVSAVAVNLQCVSGYVFDGVGCVKDASKCKYSPPPPPATQPPPEAPVDPVLG